MLVGWVGARDLESRPHPRAPSSVHSDPTSHPPARSTHSGCTVQSSVCVGNTFLESRGGNVIQSWKGALETTGSDCGCCYRAIKRLAQCEGRAVCCGDTNWLRSDMPQDYHHRTKMLHNLERDRATTTTTDCRLSRIRAVGCTDCLDCGPEAREKQRHQDSLLRFLHGLRIRRGTNYEL